jgi:hypothetical protein
MTTVIIILAICGIYRLMKGTAERRQAERAERERHRIREKQAAQRREIAEMRERAKAETRRQIEAEKARLAWQKRQDAINRQAQAERERLRKEQERQAAEMERMKHVLEQATADIDFLQDRTADLYAQLDYQLLLQAGTVPGSKQFEKYQSKIVTLKNQIHAAENKMSKAQWNRDTAQRKLA